MMNETMGGSATGNAFGYKCSLKELNHLKEHDTSQESTLKESIREILSRNKSFSVSLS